MSLIIDHAVWLAGRGWRILPVHGVQGDGSCTCGKGKHGKDAGKHPRIAAWQAEATTVPVTITSWFSRWPDSNIGIATGTEIANGFSNRFLHCLVRSQKCLPHGGESP